MKKLSNSQNIAGVHAPAAKPTLMGAALVAGLVTFPFGLLLAGVRAFF